jgi:hypothetical protein
MGDCLRLVSDGTILTALIGVWADSVENKPNSVCFRAIAGLGAGFLFRKYFFGGV